MTREEDARPRLLSQHKADETGVWLIYGEDPNCDFGGAHVEPRLGLAEGRYVDVVEYAMTLPDFFCWGRGGRLEKHEVVKVGCQLPADAPRDLIHLRFHRNHCCGVCGRDLSNLPEDEHLTDDRSDWMDAPKRGYRQCSPRPKKAARGAGKRQQHENADDHGLDWGCLNAACPGTNVDAVITGGLCEGCGNSLCWYRIVHSCADCGLDLADDWETCPRCSNSVAEDGWVRTRKPVD